MKILTEVTKKVIEETELDLPAFFKSENRKWLAIYSISHVIKVSKGSNDFRTIVRSEYDNLYKPEEMLTGERITAAEFNEVLTDALIVIANSTDLICSVHPVPLQIAS